jgi:hypothetical protein
MKIHLQEIIKNASKTHFMLQNLFRNKNISKNISKKDTKEHNNRQNINICIRNLNTNKERKKATEHF